MSSSKPALARRLAYVVLVGTLATLVALPAVGGGTPVVSPQLLRHVSQSVAFHYWAAHPERAPSQFRSQLESFRDLTLTRGAASEGSPASVHAATLPTGDRFNKDTDGMPQNEESISVCKANRDVLIGGTNDYRGLLDPSGNFTGWQLSTDGGGTVAKEGLLPSVSTGGDTRPSGGDPVDVAVGSGCTFYAASLNLDPIDPFANSNGIGIYRSTLGTLKAGNCGDSFTMTDADCWPTRRYAAFSPTATHFLDKPWLDAGNTGDGLHAWVTYTDFDLAPSPSNPAGFTAEIFAARCEADLSSCTAPIPISEDDQDVQFSDVTIGRDGRTYVTWAQIQGELTGQAQSYVYKVRVAEPGSTTFGPERTILTDNKPIPQNGFLHANDFRVATYPKNAVQLVNGQPRLFLVWESCKYRVLDVICEEPIIKLRFSDDFGQSWSKVKVLSTGGDNYFPTIDGDGNRLAVAWYSNRYDPAFHNRQDVELVTTNLSGKVLRRQRITSASNETEADPLLGGVFIGDYIEVTAAGGRAWVAYNANYRKAALLPSPPFSLQGTKVNQQDNYLTERAL